MNDRSQAAIEIARIGGALALEYFRRLESLKIEDKGPQDFVSDADRAVERHIRNLINAGFPEDGVIGEEFDDKPSASGFTWVIDPIDGTANFIAGIPAWTVVLAVVHEDRAHIGTIFDPVHDEMYLARRGQGAWLNDKPLVIAKKGSIERGSIGVGFSRRIPHGQTAAVIADLMARGGVFYRNASGALSLAYVSASRLVGYIEGHMNAWDCLAGQLLVAEAGGVVEDQSAAGMLCGGGRVVAGNPDAFPVLEAMADAHFCG
ncbi:MAG: inositol monophosphatase [Pseudomonadota bacterium]